MARSARTEQIGGDILDNGLRTLAAVAEGHLSSSGLTELEVPEELAHVQGNSAAGRVTMDLRSFGGRDWERVTVAVLADQEGRARCLTCCGLPRSGSLCPVLGLDLIALRGSLSLVALDLSPTDEAFWRSHAASILLAVHDATEGRLIARKLPEFARRTFSENALVAGTPRGAEPAAFAAAEVLLGAIPALTCDATDGGDERASAAYARNLEWRRAERSNRAEHNALGSLFGTEWTRRLFDEVLMPLP